MLLHTSWQWVSCCVTVVGLAKVAKQMPPPLPDGRFANIYADFALQILEPVGLRIGEDNYEMGVVLKKIAADWCKIRRLEIAAWSACLEKICEEF